MRLFEEIGGNVTGNGLWQKRQEKKKITLRAFASRAKNQAFGIKTNNIGKSNKKKKS